MTPLWTDDNHTADSAAFTVRPGEAALVVATGLLPQRVKTDAKEFDSPQLACLSRLIPIAETTIRTTVVSPCPQCASSQAYERIESSTVEVPVLIDGCRWQIDACNNIRILALPGTYRFHLNDETAVGEAQIYVEIYKLEQLAPNIKPEF